MLHRRRCELLVTLLTFWLLVNAPVLAQPDLATPGEAAATAYAQLESEDDAEKAAGCEAFVRQVREGSKDPWAYRGSALCAEQLESTRPAVEAAFDALSADSPLALFGRGYLANLDEKPDEAAELYRRAVEQEPRLALAWNALGAIVREAGRYGDALGFIDRALQLAPEMGVAQNNRERTQLYAGVFERLEARLREIPRRWDELPEPRIPYSGKGPSEVLASSTEDENQAALFFIATLALAPLDDRASLIERWLQARDPTEVDLWLPGLLAQNERRQSDREAALTLEAWLQWAETLGRQDALLWAASNSTDVLMLQVGTQAAESFRAWTSLEPTPQATHGAARFQMSFAGLSFRLGENQEAINAYRNARALFEKVGDQLGQGNTFKGEADVLFRLGENQEAINAYRNARALFEKVGDQLGQGNTWRGEADVLFLLGENQEAINAYRNARALFEKVGDQLGQGNTFKGEADVLFRLGENQEAINAYRNARALFEKVGSQLGQGNTWRGEADVLFLLGENQEAINAYRNARALFEKVGDQLGQGNTFKGEADVLFRLGENQEAINAYRNARALFEKVGDQLGQGNTWRGEADVLFLLGENQEAINAYRNARALFEKVGDQLGQGNTWRGEADVLFRLGENQEAINAYRNARALFEKVGSQLGQGNTWLGEADVLFLLGENQEAINAYRNARALFEKVGSQLGQGNTWLGEADVLFLLGENQEAINAYRNARALFEKVGSQLGQGNTFKGEADVLFRLGENQEAINAYRNARALFEKVGDQLGQGNTWRGEADVLFRLGENQEAAKLAAKAAEIAKNMASTQNELLATLTEARSRKALGQNEATIQLAKHAISLFDTWRAGLLDEEQRTRRESYVNQVYEILIPALLEEGQTFEALEQAEKARARVLLDLVATGHARKERDPQFNLQGQADAVEEKLAQISRKLTRSLPPQERRDLQIEQSALDLELKNLGFEILLANEESLASAQPLSWEAIQATARDLDGPSLIFYVAAGETLAAFFRGDSNEPRIERLELPWGTTGRSARDFAEYLANPIYEHLSTEPAQTLWNQLIAPFQDLLPPSGPLLIIPHGPLHQVPFSALTNPKGERLGERFDLSFTPSFSTLHHLRQRYRAPTPKDRFLTLASGSGLTLPNLEIRQIATFFNPEDVAGYQATRARFRTYEERAPQAHHLLIASQGVHTPGSRTDTYLEILPSDAHDHRLKASEIARIPLQAQLVTLAACDTAYAEALLSDERLDLTRAFLIAGANAVLATRWKVPEDHRTSRFLVDFYRAYRQGGPEDKGLRKDQALSEARRLSMERGDPAQIWAAWILVGDAR